MDGFSRADLLKFLDFLQDKGLMNADTVGSRRVAVTAVLGILDEDEASDVRTVDMDSLMTRFVNKKGNGFKPESLKLYKARASKALEDFVFYKKDPLSFKPGLTTRGTKSAAENTREAKDSQDVTRPQKTAQTQGLGTETLVFPIPIRPGVVIKIAGIPSDLTTSEAKRVSSVIMALATTE